MQIFAGPVRTWGVWLAQLVYWVWLVALAVVPFTPAADDRSSIGGRVTAAVFFLIVAGAPQIVIGIGRKTRAIAVRARPGAEVISVRGAFGGGKRPVGLVLTPDTLELVAPHGATSIFLVKWSAVTSVVLGGGRSLGGADGPPSTTIVVKAVNYDPIALSVAPDIWWGLLFPYKPAATRLLQYIESIRRAAAERAEADPQVELVHQAPPPVGPPATSYAVTLDTGESVSVHGWGYLGCRPQAEAGERCTNVIGIDDPHGSLSPTHLRFGIDATGFWVEDRGSANGTFVLGPDGASMQGRPGERLVVPPGGAVRMGSRTFTVSPLA